MYLAAILDQKVQCLVTTDIIIYLYLFEFIFVSLILNPRNSKLVTYTLRRRKLIGDYIPYRRLIVYYAVFEREGVVCEWL